MGAKLDALIKEVNKQAKEEIITTGISNFNYERIPFTSPRMNYVTYGGIPVGKITEFFGEEHGGKTTTALDIVANYQNMHPEKEILFVDAENTLDIDWATKIGVDVSELKILQPKTQSAEEIFDIICDAVMTSEVGLWVLDSIGALMSKQEWEKAMDEKTYAGIALPLTKFGKKVEMLNARYSCTGIAINQLRDNMNSTWGGTRTPGGRSWRHMCSVRIEFSQGKFLDAKGKEISRGAENPVGNIVMANQVKNKTCPPKHHIGQYTINYDIGIDYIYDLIDVAILYNVVDKHGAWYNIIDINTGEILKENIQGQAELHAILDEDVELMQHVEEMVNAKMQQK